MDTNIISALGGGSGIDTKKLVSQLVEVEKAPQQNRIDSQKEKLQSQISAYGLLKSSLSEFQNALAPLSNNDTFNARSVAFPETGTVTPNSLDANAQVGTYQLGVESTAQSQSLAVNTSFADANAAMNVEGNLTIKLGEWAYDGSNNPQSFTENEAQKSLTIEVVAEDSLQDLADKINAADSNVQASVLLVDGEHQLLLSGPSGKANALEVTNDNSQLDIFSYNASNHANVTQTQQARDAEITINGLTVFRESNEIDDVIPGLSFTLNKAEPGETFTFSISQDKGTAEQAIRDFVTAYNSLYETAKNLTGLTTDEETNETTAGNLSTDGAAKAVIAQLRSMMTGAVAGVDGSNSLSSIGIRTQLDGTLELTDDFSNAVSDNFAVLQNIFAPQTSSSTNQVDVTIGNYAGNTVPGSYTGTVTAPPTKGTVRSDIPFAAFTTGAGDNTFSIAVDGTTSGVLELSGTFNTAEELRVELQSLINNDKALKDAGNFVDVVVDGGQIQLVSRTYGSSSKVVFETAGAEFATNTGLSETSSSVIGNDVQGTINGEPAFGAGEILLAKIDSDPYGLNFAVKEGMTGDFSFTFSRGLSSELNRLIDGFLGDNGAINSREENINRQIKGLATDQENLDRRMTIYQTRLTQQYLAMERVVASLNTTSDSLNGLTDRLPFTAKSS